MFFFNHICMLYILWDRMHMSKIHIIFFQLSQNMLSKMLILFREDLYVTQSVFFEYFGMPLELESRSDYAGECVLVLRPMWIKIVCKMKKSKRNSREKTRTSKSKKKLDINVKPTHKAGWTE